MCVIACDWIVWAIVVLCVCVCAVWQTDGLTPLHATSHNGHVEVVGALTRRSVRLTTAVSKQSAAQVRGLGAKLLLMWMLVCEA